MARAVSDDEICVVENGGQTLLADAHLVCFGSQDLETEWESFETAPAASFAACVSRIPFSFVVSVLAVALSVAFLPSMRLLTLTWASN